MGEQVIVARNRIIFQPYMAGRGARLVPGVAVVCRDAEDAQRRADKAMAGGRIIGAQIIRVQDDEAAGDYGEPECLVAMGRVPDAGI